MWSTCRYRRQQKGKPPIAKTGIAQCSSLSQSYTIHNCSCTRMRCGDTWASSWYWELTAIEAKCGIQKRVWLDQSVHFHNKSMQCVLSPGAHSVTRTSRNCFEAIYCKGRGWGSRPPIVHGTTASSKPHETKVAKGVPSFSASKNWLRCNARVPVAICGIDCRVTNTARHLYIMLGVWHLGQWSPSIKGWPIMT